MAGDTPGNPGVPEAAAYAAALRVLQIQSKLHDRAVAGPGRVFDDLSSPGFVGESVSWFSGGWSGARVMREALRTRRVGRGRARRGAFAG